MIKYIVCLGLSWGITSLGNAKEHQFLSMRLGSCNKSGINVFQIEDDRGFSESKEVTTVSSPTLWNDDSFRTTEGYYRFVSENRNQIEQSFGEFSKYFPVCRQVFTFSGIPEEFIYLAHLDFDVKANGNVWNLSSAAAIAYGLQVNSQIDERNDILKSSKALALYIQDLHHEFHSWTLALAAYIGGPQRIQEIRASYPNIQHFDELISHLSGAEIEKLKAFLRAQAIDKNRDTYRIKSLGEDNISSLDTVIVTKAMHLDQVAAVLSIEVEHLQDINASLLSKVIDGALLPYLLTLPQSKGEEYERRVDEIMAYRTSELLPAKPDVRKAPAFKSFVYVPPKGVDKYTYTVRGGDVLGRIAEQHGVRVSSLQQWNNLRGTRINVGQKLTIYGKSSAPKQNITKTKVVQPSEVVDDGTYVIHTVKSGESPWIIAHEYPGVSADNILQLNGIQDARNIRPGMKLKIKKK